MKTFKLIYTTTFHNGVEIEAETKEEAIKIFDDECSGYELSDEMDTMIIDIDGEELKH